MSTSRPSPKVPLTNYQAVDPTKINGLQLLASFERAVYLGKTPEAIELFGTFVEYLSRNAGAQGVLSPRPAPAKLRAFYTRIAAAISALVNSPNFGLSEQQVGHISTRKPTLESIFELSGFDGPEHFIEFHAAASTDGTLKLTGGQVFFLALFYSLDRMPDTLMAGVLQLPPNQLIMLTLGWLSAPAVLTSQGESNRQALLNAHGKIAQATLNPATGMVLSLTTTWMHCSYADSPIKHQMKAALNSVWRRLCQAEDVRPRCAERRVVERPTLLVLAERMQMGHAMHRSYGDLLVQLKRKFHVVCVAHESNYEEAAASMFDEVDVMRGNMPFDAIAGRVIRHKADVILFPSLGMSEWTQAMANHRFAPIQIMLLGHPAPAMCDTIDYSMVQAGMVEAAHEFGAKIIERQAWGKFVPHLDLPAATERAPIEDDALHIAINSSKMKLSPRFLAVCERLQAEAGRPLHFHFFASVNGVSFDRTFSLLEGRFKRMTLHPPRPYDQFLTYLSRCDIALSAFPFGNTNSTVDTCLLGIPNVAYFANEVLSIGDRDVMRMAGLPDWLVAESDEGYFQAAMRLVRNDADRKLLCDLLRTSDVRARFFAQPASTDPDEFVDAVRWVYDNHEKLQQSSAHAFRVGEPLGDAA